MERSAVVVRPLLRRNTPDLRVVCSFSSALDVLGVSCPARHRPGKRTAAKWLAGTGPAGWPCEPQGYRRGQTNDPNVNYEIGTALRYEQWLTFGLRFRDPVGGQSARLSRRGNVFFPLPCRLHRFKEELRGARRPREGRLRTCAGGFSRIGPSRNWKLSHALDRSDFTNPVLASVTRAVRLYPRSTTAGRSVSCKRPRIGFPNARWGPTGGLSARRVRQRKMLVRRTRVRAESHLNNGVRPGPPPMARTETGETSILPDLFLPRKNR